MVLVNALACRYINARYPNQVDVNARFEWQGNFYHNNFVTPPGWKRLNAYEQAVQGCVEGRTIVIHATQQEVTQYGWVVLG